MSLSKARITLVSVFLLFFVIQISAIIVVFCKGEIYSHEMLKILLRLLVIYSVHFAVIFGGIFGQHVSGGHQAPKYAFSIALFLSIIWNCLLCWRPLFFCFSINDTSASLLDYMNNVGSSSSILVAGALSFFFARR